ncbi:MAG TPA: hypothetical protein DCZ92_10885 [Elusimicrobia bacterium]|nr:hypothetical protein [Elusimicrobiota bacterium]
MKKLILVFTAVFGSGLALGQAGEMESLKTSLPELSSVKASYFQQNINAPAPSAAAPLQVPGVESADPVLNALSDAQWDAILGSQPWEEAVAAEDISVNKELYGDYHARYIVKGNVSFKTNPPTFTTESGKVFKVVKYPKWLKDVGDTRICVEGYAKQRDNTSEFVIKKMLPPTALENIMPAAEMQALQRDPVIMSQDASGYVLGNVNWNLQHAADGARVKDQYGNFVSEWQSGVVVKPELLEQAYFVKKTTLKPVRYGDHGFLMFKFKPGGVTAADGRSTRVLVVSLDAYYKDQSNMSYSPIAALKGKYLVYYSIQTTERYSEFKMEQGNQTMTMYPLNISRAQQLQLMDNAFKKATDDNKGEAYSLFYNSCANSALSLVNSVLEKNRKIKSGWLPEIIYRVKTTFPDAIAGTLIKKGIVAKPLPEITAANYRHAYDF